MDIYVAVIEINVWESVKNLDKINLNTLQRMIRSIVSFISYSFTKANAGISIRIKSEKNRNPIVIKASLKL